MPAFSKSASLPGLRLAQSAAIALAGSALLTLSAKISVPFYPVPLSMQTLAVLVLGAVLGARLGAATVALYLIEGAAGLPVFAGTPEKGLGLLYMMGPTGGFLVGFLIAAALVGYIADRGWDRSLPRLALSMAIGHAVIFAFGFCWLAGLIGIKGAWLGGVAPFAWATVLKTALAAALVAAWRSRVVRG